MFFNALPFENAFYFKFFKANVLDKYFITFWKLRTMACPKFVLQNAYMKNFQKKELFVADFRNLKSEIEEDIFRTCKVHSCPEE